MTVSVKSIFSVDSEEESLLPRGPYLQVDLRAGHGTFSHVLVPLTALKGFLAGLRINQENKSLMAQVPVLECD